MVVIIMIYVHLCIYFCVHISRSQGEIVTFIESAQKRLHSGIEGNCLCNPPVCISLYREFFTHWMCYFINKPSQLHHTVLSMTVSMTVSMTDEVTLYLRLKTKYLGWIWFSYEKRDFACDDNNQCNMCGNQQSLKNERYFWSMKRRGW